MSTPPDEVVCYLGLGSNLGDRRANIEAALARLAQTPGIRVLAVSSLQQYPFVGDGPEQDPYLNGAARVATSLPPNALLAVCKALERAAGRTLPAPRNQPRQLDLDVLLYGGQTIDDKDLVVPHPRLFERAFVLEPLRELGVDTGAVPRLELPAVLVSADDFAARCSRWQRSGFCVGLVPTMGALHRGHRSLLDRARLQCDRLVATIFVNPLQFGPNEDLAAYPRDLEGDLRLCREAGVDAVFAPTPAQMYPAGFCSRIAVGAAAEGMEGAVRPGHFEGVATVVARLFALCRPQFACFGQKDAQQLAVIRRMTADLGFPLQLIECPTVREADGLALSSRNVFLSPDDRRASTVLFRALQAARAAFAGGERDRDALLAIAAAVLAVEQRAQVDYLELRRDGDLLPLPPGRVDGGRMLVAARFAGGARPVRLIDNLALAEAAP